MCDGPTAEGLTFENAIYLKSRAGDFTCYSGGRSVGRFVGWSVGPSVETSDAQVLRQRGRKKSCQSGAKKVSSRSFPLRLVKL